MSMNRNLRSLVEEKAHKGTATKGRKNMEGAYLRFVDMMGADLSSSNLTGVDAIGTNFKDANLTGAYFLSANFDGANFDGADFSDADLSGAKNLDKAILPKGYRLVKG